MLKHVLAGRLKALDFGHNGTYTQAEFTYNFELIQYTQHQSGKYVYQDGGDIGDLINSFAV